MAPPNKFEGTGCTFSTPITTILVLKKSFGIFTTDENDHTPSNKFGGATLNSIVITMQTIFTINIHYFSVPSVVNYFDYCNRIPEEP